MTDSSSPPGQPPSGRLPPKRPYLLRALHEWMTDNDLTPHVVIAADEAGVHVPRQHVEEGRILLNISYTATRGLSMGNEELGFEARFGGTPFRVTAPMRAVLGIYARESGEGLVFPPEEYEGGEPPSDGGDPPQPDPPQPPSRPNLKIVR